MSSYIIIEDDKHTVTMLNDIVSSNFKDINFLGDASTISDGIELIKTKQPNFIFLDVNLEDGKSFNILKQFVNPNFKVIFVTSYSKYAVDAFKFSAIDFVLKPFTTNEILAAVEKVIKEHDKDNYTKLLDTFFYNYSSAENKKLVLKNLDEIHVVNIDDIIYIKSDNNYSTFHLKNDKEILVSKTLKSFEEKLKGTSFFRCHQSYLVNLNLMKSYDKKNDLLVFLNKAELPVSQSKKAFLLDFLNKLS